MQNEMSNKFEIGRFLNCIRICKDIHILNYNFFKCKKYFNNKISKCYNNNMSIVLVTFIYSNIYINIRDIYINKYE